MMLILAPLSWVLIPQGLGLDEHRGLWSRHRHDAGPSFQARELLLSEATNRSDSYLGRDAQRDATAPNEHPTRNVRGRDSGPVPGGRSPGAEDLLPGSVPIPIGCASTNGGGGMPHWKASAEDKMRERNSSC